jgi:hypothetical protein
MTLLQNQEYPVKYLNEICRLDMPQFGTFSNFGLLLYSPGIGVDMKQNRHFRDRRGGPELLIQNNY